jgi:hypothetical protein
VDSNIYKTNKKIMIQSSKPSSYDILDTRLKININANVLFITFDIKNSTYTMTVEESIQEPYVIEEQVYDDQGELINTISNTFYQTKNLRTYKETISFEEVNNYIKVINNASGSVENSIDSFIANADEILVSIYNKKLIRNSTWSIYKAIAKT